MRSSRLFPLILSLCSLAPTPSLAQARLALFSQGSRGKGYGYLTEGISLDAPVGRAAWLWRWTGNEVFSEHRVFNMLSPDSKPGARHYFSRFQTGVRAPLPRHAALEVLGGADFLGSRAHTLEGRVSFWPVFYSYHPVQLSVGASIDDATHILAKSVNASIGLGRVWAMTWFAIGSGQLYQGKLLPKAENQASGGISAMSRSRGWGFSISGGGGSNGGVAELGIFQAFNL